MPDGLSPDLWMTLPQLASKLGISEKILRIYIRQGLMLMPIHLAKGCNLYPVEEFEHLLWMLKNAHRLTKHPEQEEKKRTKKVGENDAKKPS